MAFVLSQDRSVLILDQANSTVVVLTGVICMFLLPTIPESLIFSKF